MTRHRRSAISFLWVCWLVLGCDAGAQKPEHTDFVVGMERSAVLPTFGTPDHEQTMVKQSEAIWGPSEDFWPQVPNGAKVEIWSYESQVQPVERSDETKLGSTELYFVNDSPTVEGVGFAPDGVVY